LESVILVDSRGPARTVTLRSRAVFLMLRELGGAWAWLGMLRVFPAFLTDLGYRVVASLRYRIWGQLDACRLPSPDERARFLA
jgi:predicted DCC family thiol-disulfide oxidoreductase YuxK